MTEPTTSRTADWMSAYQDAWTSNDPADIRALFTEDAHYRTEPYAEPWTGVDAIVSGWLELADGPGSFTFEWAPLVETAELALVQGTTRYTDGPVYSNLWVIRFAPDGRATAFTEWYMDQGRHTDDGGVDRAPGVQ
jgi:hypothetical protein